MSGQTHQLAAIMFTDIVGYTAMMEGQAIKEKLLKLHESINLILRHAISRFCITS